jgi:flagellar basal body-associated protein FliL
MKHVKKTFNFKILWIVLGIVLGVLIIAYGATTYYFSSHFGFNTSIDNVSCAFKTVDEVEQAISERVGNYELRITGRDGLDKSLKASDIALTYVSDGQVKALLESQNPFLWITRLFRDQSKETTHASVKLDEKKLKATIDKFDLFNTQKMKPPVDAYTEFDGTAYVVRPETPGSTLDEGRVRKAIDEVIRVLTSTVDLDEEGCYTPPKIFANNPDLIKQVDTYNTYVPFAITYTFGDKTELLDAKIALDWIDIASDGTGTLNEDALIAWVRDFGLRYDTVGIERTFTTAAGAEATVQGGTYGWEVDEPAEIEAIKAAIANHTGETREPYYVQRAAEHTAFSEPDWGSTYIELDLTNQHMYYLVDGAVEFEADVVTGAPWGGRATPQGVYSILEMLSPTVLRGEIQASGKPEYETPVKYWMRMTWMGHGFHDATWQPAFGGNRYTYAGSHGCINMSYSSAQTLYGMIEVGVPVISHY